ncbi:MAG: hypothetical protein EAZ97_09455 [Bacteroidetes bacterium]|nr:MAG: hypothetical protein EAZ97_09455 [Bacteroidota bacterium]
MENTISKKLEALLKLQQIDSKVDEIEKTRGDLPEEVQDLEDEIVGYGTRIGKLQEELKETEKETVRLKQAVKDAEKLIEKYKQQQNNVRNGREFEAIAKEIELQELEMQLLDKKIKEVAFQIKRKEGFIAETQKLKDDRSKDLENKRKELDIIIAEGEEDISKLMKDREKRSKQIDERLYLSYMKVRKNARNGLAVVSVRRDACGGCFNIVPPQRQADIKDKKKIIVCEHCGRILADVIDVPIDETKIPKKGVLGKKPILAGKEEEAL